MIGGLVEGVKGDWWVGGLSEGWLVGWWIE